MIIRRRPPRPADADGASFRRRRRRAELDRLFLARVRELRATLEVGILERMLDAYRSQGPTWRAVVVERALIRVWAELCSEVDASADGGRAEGPDPSAEGDQGRAT